MKRGLTELVFILDKSGSMRGLENDTIGGYNSLMHKQQALEGECYVTTVLFDNGYTLLHDRINLQAIGPITHKEYQVGGGTALLDAVGLSIDKIGNAQKQTAEDYRAERVMVVIITDGEENASRLYTAEQIRRMIKHQKKKYGWEFVFIGANMDAVQTAGNYGIASDRAVDYVADPQGTNLNFSMMSRAVEGYRQCGQVDEQSLDQIRKDAAKRRRQG